MVSSIHIVLLLAAGVVYVSAFDETDWNLTLDKPRNIKTRGAAYQLLNKQSKNIATKNLYHRKSTPDTQNYYKDVLSTLRNMVIPADLPIEKQVLGMFQEAFIELLTNLALVFSRLPESEQLVVMKTEAEAEQDYGYNYGVTDVDRINQVVGIIFEASPKLINLKKGPQLIDNGSEELKEMVEMIKPIADGILKMMIAFNQETIDF